MKRGSKPKIPDIYESIMKTGTEALIEGAMAMTGITKINGRVCSRPRGRPRGS